MANTHLVFLLLLLPFGHCNADHQRMATVADHNSSCRSWCGQHKIQFPVGTDTGCGTPQLSMSCINSSILHININSKLFTVDTIDYSKKTLILRDYQMTDCKHLRSSVSANVSLEFGGQGSSDEDSVLLLGHKNTILLLNCVPPSTSFFNKELDCFSGTCLSFIAECHNNDFLTSCCRVIDPTVNGIDPQVAQQCGSYTSIYHPKEPIFDPTSWSYGIEIQWTLPPDLSNACRQCQAKNGICGYDNRKKFKCLCYSSMGCKGCSSHLCSKTASALVIGFATAAGLFTAMAYITCIIMRWSCQQRWTQKIRSVAEEDHLHTEKIRFGSEDNLCTTDEQPSTSSSSSETANHHDLVVNAMASTTITATGALLHLAMFTYRELEQATRLFSAPLANGIHSVIYRAEFCNGRILAVKRFGHTHHNEGLKLFRNEAKVLLRLSHPNIVKMEGFCTEGTDPLLVYESVCKGTLEHHMHGLPWQARLKAACEVAEALEYLHFSASPPTCHRDVKMGNILLDPGMRAKVANFESSVTGLGARTKTEHSDHPQDMNGDHTVTSESDVFGFGVMLLELVYGKKAVDLWRPEMERILSSQAMYVELDKIKEGAMEKLQGTETLLPEQAQAAILALRCISYHSRDRPDMRQVSAQLQFISSGLRIHGPLEAQI